MPPSSPGKKRDRSAISAKPVARSSRVCESRGIVCDFAVGLDPAGPPTEGPATWTLLGAYFFLPAIGMQPGPGPLSGAGQHVAAADDTCASIAKKLGLDAQALVRINKERYPALTKHAKLMADTLLLLHPRARAMAHPRATTGARASASEPLNMRAAMPAA